MNYSKINQKVTPTPNDTTHTTYTIHTFPIKECPSNAQHLFATILCSIILHCTIASYLFTSHHKPCSENLSAIIVRPLDILDISKNLQISQIWEISEILEICRHLRCLKHFRHLVKRAKVVIGRKESMGVDGSRCGRRIERVWRVWGSRRRHSAVIV